MGLGRLRHRPGPLRRPRLRARAERHLTEKPRNRGSEMSQLLKVQNFVVSQDGFGSGEGQSLERPFGHANPAELMAWAGSTASWPNHTDPGGSRGRDDPIKNGRAPGRERVCQY